MASKVYSMPELYEKRRDLSTTRPIRQRRSVYPFSSEMAKLTTDTPVRRWSVACSGSTNICTTTPVGPGDGMTTSAP